jgi:hypothetical protein
MQPGQVLVMRGLLFARYLPVVLAAVKWNVAERGKGPGPAPLRLQGE